MKGIIWYYTNQEDGMNRFQQLIKDYKYTGINVIKIVSNKSNTFVQFDNDDYWSLACARENMKGAACNVALIQREIPQQIVREIIMPCIKSYPYRAYNYW